MDGNNAITQHTPTPWTWHDLGDGKYSIVHWGPLAYLGDAKEPGDGAANAALIVRAVNAHADLVAACKPIIEAGEDGRIPEDAVITIQVFAHEFDALRAALAKAGA